MPLTDAEIDRVLEDVAAVQPEALAICLLHSYANPEHEQRIERRARQVLPPACFICTSFRVLPEIKEYERTSTTVINAYIGPAIQSYCQRLRGALDAAGFSAPIRIMQSNGGVLSLEEVLEIPAYIVESGPAAGVIGAAMAGARWGEPNLITVDMGGTTAKAALIEDGRIGRTNEYEVGAGINISSKLVKGGGHALKLPVLDISEIGAGGGSIARVSRQGTLAVGPDSAGAVPGPACYAKGGVDPTLTDALDIDKVIFPLYAGLYSAVGLLHAAVEREMSQTWLQPLRSLTNARLDAAFLQLEARVRALFRGHPELARLRVRRFADLRFHGQAFELTIPLAADTDQHVDRLGQAFVDEHRRSYGHGSLDDPIDLVNLRVSAGLPATPAAPEAAIERATALRLGTRAAYFGVARGVLDTPVLSRQALQDGLAGPAIIEETDATALIPPGWQARLGADSSIVLHRTR